MVVRLPTLTLSRPRPIGPRDHGRRIRERDYMRCSDQAGYISELIDGAIHVSPSARPLHQDWQLQIARYLLDIAEGRPRVINHVAMDNDVVIHHRPGPTRPRPDVTAYRGFPSMAEVAINDDWADYCPVLVVEVISRRRAKKDTLRNRNLYWQENGILEYWVVDPRKDALAPALLVHAREKGQSDWVEYRLEFGETWKSRLVRGLGINLTALRKKS